MGAFKRFLKGETELQQRAKRGEVGQGMVDAARAKQEAARERAEAARAERDSRRQEKRAAKGK